MDQALATQLANIERRTGRSLADISAVIRSSGLVKHGEIRDMLKRDLGMGHGDANALIHASQQPPGTGPDPTEDEVLAAIYAGPKAGLRPIHDKLMAAIRGFGPFELAPKKGYVSLRRKKQFAMIGPPANTRVEVGLNVKDLPANQRLLELPPGGMCPYKVKLTTAAEVDSELLAWIRRAYDTAG
jgi:hypothetical protein